MKYLLDTSILLLAAAAPEKLGQEICERLEDRHHQLFFSTASFWEMALKLEQGVEGFKVDLMALRRALLENEYEELPITSDHTMFTLALAKHHDDPIDRILIAQAWVEDLVLMTVDPQVARYVGPIELVSIVESGEMHDFGNS